MEGEAEAIDGIAGIARGDTLLTVWSGPANSERWTWQYERLRQLAAKNAEVLLFSVILSSSDPPDGALRSRMQADFRALDGKLRKVVIVPVGSSMWMSVVRTLVRAILLVSGQAKLQAVVSSVDEGLSRVADEASPRTPSRIELRAMLEKISLTLGVPELERALGAGAS